MDKKIDKAMHELLHGALNDAIIQENIASIYYDLHEKTEAKRGAYTPPRLQNLSDDDQKLLSDIMEYFFYPDQAPIAREVFSTALIITATKVLRSYAKP